MKETDMAETKKPRIGSIVHITPADHRVCSMGSVLSVMSGDNETMLVEVKQAQKRALEDKPGSSGTEPEQFPQVYLALDAVTEKGKQDRVTWHWPDDCPWER